MHLHFCSSRALPPLQPFIPLLFTRGRRHQHHPHAAGKSWQCHTTAGPGTATGQSHSFEKGKSQGDAGSGDQAVCKIPSLLDMLSLRYIYTSP